MTDDASPSNAITSISGGVNLEADRIDIGGDVVGRDKIVQNIQNIYQRALTVAEQARQARSIEAEYLAQGVSAFAQRLQARAGESTDAGKSGPYKGLLEYRLSDAEIFFGRDRAIQELLEYLQRGPLTVLHAESGAGKTSLLQAGISPRLLAAGYLPIYLRPYNVAPSLALKRAFLPNLSDTPNLTQAPLRDFLARVCDVLGTWATLYIFFDQFEEFFTQLDETARPDFVRELAECLEDESLNVCWVLALRSEYFGNLASFRPRIRNPFENDYRLNRLTRDEAREAVTKPAARRGISFEDGLIDTILDDLGKDEVAPPQAQLVCSTLYAALAPDAKIITRELYAAQGGAAGILRGHLGRVLKRDLPAEQRPIAQRLLEELITSDIHRVMRVHTELVSTLAAQGVKAETLDAVLGQLVDSRLLRVEETEGGPAYELAHDYLLGEINLDPAVQARKAAQELLEQEVRAYRRYNTLLTADRLQVIEPFAADLRLTPEAQQLLEGSRAAVQREREEEEIRRQKELDDARKLAESEARRAEEQARSAAGLRRRSLYLIVALVLAVLFGMAAGAFGIQANRTSDANATLAAQKASIAGTAQANAEEAQRQARIASSRQLAAQFNSYVEDQFDLALLLSVESSRFADTVEARNSLFSGLERQLGLITFLRGHSDEVTSTAFSPDGKTLASGSWDRTIILWDVSNPKAPTQLGTPLVGHTDYVLSVAFSPDGRTLASGGLDKTIVLWDVSNRQSPVQLGAPLTGHRGFVLNVVFSPDRQMLASVSRDGAIILWDISNLQSPVQLGALPSGHKDWIPCIAFSPDGQTLASGSYDKTIILWDVSKPQSPVQLGAPISGHTDAVRSVTFSPDGKTLASGSDDHTIILWDITDRQSPVQLGAPLSGHTSIVSSIAFSPDGKMLASGSWDRTIDLWNVSDRRRPIQLDTPLRGHGGQVESVVFSPDGKILASSSQDKAIILWDILNRQQPIQVGKPFQRPFDIVNSLALSPDGKTLATGGQGRPIGLWDISNRQAPVQLGAVLRKLDIKELLSAEVRSVSFSSDGQTLASGSLDGMISLWDVSNRQEPIQLGTPISGHTSIVLSIAFSPDGLTLASGSLDGMIKLWDVSNRRVPVQLGTPLSNHGGQVWSMAFSPDGQTLATVGNEQTIVLWDVTNPQLPTALGAPLQGHTATVRSVAFSPDGKTLASGSNDKTVILWDVSNRESPVQSGAPLKGHTAGVYSVAFSPDGERLASSSNDKTIILWDVSNRRSPVQLGVPFGHRLEAMRSVAFSPDGKILASGSGDGTITLWDVDLVSWQSHACQMAGHNFTRVEWTQYMGDQPYRKTCDQWPLESEATPTPTPTP